MAWYGVRRAGAPAGVPPAGEDSTVVAGALPASSVGG